MNPVEIAIELARKVVAALKDAAQAAPTGPSIEFGLSVANAELRRAVDDAYERDRKHMWSWLGPLSLLTPALLAAAKAAETWGLLQRDACRALLAQQASALSEAEEAVTSALPTLKAGQVQWKKISYWTAKGLPEVIARLRQVPGWEGNAASGYGAMTETQNSAAEQLNTSTQTLPDALGKVVELNVTIMKALGIEIRLARQKVDGRAPSLPGAFECTAFAWGQVIQLQKTIEEQLELETMKAEIEALDAKVDEARQRLPEPWPKA